MNLKQLSLSNCLLTNENVIQLLKSKFRNSIQWYLKIKDLKNLTYLDLSINDVNEEAFENLDDLKNLKCLNISYTLFGGENYSKLMNVKNLILFEISNTFPIEKLKSDFKIGKIYSELNQYFESIEDIYSKYSTFSYTFAYYLIEDYFSLSPKGRDWYLIHFNSKIEFWKEI